MPGIIWNGEIPHSSAEEVFCVFFSFFFVPFLHPNTLPLVNSLTSNPVNSLGMQLYQLAELNIWAKQRALRPSH